MDSADDDPRRIRSLAVTAGDVVTAYEASQRSSRQPVLRVTPTFSGRMRARLHDPGPPSDARDSATDLAPETGAVHVPPERFLDEDAISPYPDPDRTEDALRADPDVEFTTKTHRERHVEAVAVWREGVADAVVECVELRLPDGSHQVDVKTLGESSDV